MKAKTLQQAHDDQFLAVGNLELLPDPIAGGTAKAGTRLHYASRGAKQGTSAQVFFAFWRTYFRRLQYEHIWTGIFSRDITIQVVLSRPQRMTVLTAACLACMAANALLFGKGASEAARHVRC